MSKVPFRKSRKPSSSLQLPLQIAHRCLDVAQVAPNALAVLHVAEGDFGLSLSLTRRRDVADFRAQPLNSAIVNYRAVAAIFGNLPDQIVLGSKPIPHLELV